VQLPQNIQSLLAQMLGDSRPDDPGLRSLAPVVRAAGTCAHRTRYALALCVNFADDHDLLEQGLIVYNAHL
jgi:hypothetical protein